MGPDVDSLVWFMRALCSSNGFMYQVDPYAVPMPFNEDIYSSTVPLTIGYYDHDNWMSATPACRRAVQVAKQVLESRGHRLIPVPFPFDVPEMRWLMEVYVAGVFPDGGTEMAALLAKDIVDPAHKSLARFVSTPIWLRKFKAHFTTSPYFRTLLRGCESDSAGVRAKYADIFRLKAKFAKFWDQYNLDAIICPVAATPALPINVPPRFMCIYWSYCALYNLLNYSAGTARCTQVTPEDEAAALNPIQANRGGLDDDDWVPKLFRECQRGSTGLPVGVQVVTLPFREELCLRVMKEIEFGLAL
jgi:Asp-tRNA(Asn)/Glu-tRNA(Gln) amidotransferase A subunit family amidase